MSHFNVEFKARCENPGKIRSFLRDSSAQFVGLDEQTDTYFEVPNGRLKLREGKIENYLIFYKRGDEAGPKKSEVVLYKPSDIKKLKEILLKSLSAIVSVKKTREIFFIDNVKFHIDRVDNLGGFIEVEAISPDGKVPEETLQRQCNHYLKAFGINEEDLVASSYSDLLEGRQ